MWVKSSNKGGMRAAHAGARKELIVVDGRVCAEACAFGIRLYVTHNIIIKISTCFHSKK